MAAWVRSRLNSASSELSLGRADATFSLCDRASSSRMVESRSPRSCRISAAKHFSSRSRPEQQVLGADVLVVQPLGFFGAIGQHALALVAERQIHGSGNLLADGGVSFDLLADGFHRGVRAQEPVRERLVFAQQAEEQVFGFDIGTAELAGLVPREEDHPSRLLRVSLKHRM